MVKIVPPEQPEDSWVSKVAQQFKAFALDKVTLDHVKKHQDSVKRDLMDALDEFGYGDDKGHIWIDFEEPIEGFAGMQKQRRVNQGMDEDAIKRILDDKGLTDRCYKPVITLDQDEVMALLYEGLLTEDEIDAMFPKTITWAFVPKKA